MWQDFVISGVSFAFGFMIMPQVIDSFKGKSYLNLVTALLTIVGLLILGFTFVTINMWSSAIANFFTCIMWVMLFSLSFKNYLRKKNERSLIS